MIEDRREIRVQRLQSEVLDILSARVCLGAFALRACLSSTPNPGDLRLALERLRRAGCVEVVGGARRSASYLLVGGATV